MSTGHLYTQLIYTPKRGTKLFITLELRYRRPRSGPKSEKAATSSCLFCCRNRTWKKRAKRSKNTEVNCSCVNTCPKFGAFLGCESYSKESGPIERRLRWRLRRIRSSSQF